MTTKKQQNILKNLLGQHNKYLIPIVALSFFTAYLPVTPIVYMWSVFGPVVNMTACNITLAYSFIDQCASIKRYIRLGTRSSIDGRNDFILLKSRDCYL